MALEHLERSIHLGILCQLGPARTRGGCAKKRQVLFRCMALEGVNPAMDVIDRGLLWECAARSMDEVFGRGAIYRDPASTTSFPEAPSFREAE